MAYSTIWPTVPRLALKIDAKRQEASGELGLQQSLSANSPNSDETLGSPYR
jgi:hypothetical protein